MSDGLSRRAFGVALAGVALHAAGTAQAQGDPVADFYRGKTVTILVGYEGGGGYDLYARLIAPFLGKHIPGNPTVIVQNRPASGPGVVRAFVDTSPRDGSLPDLEWPPEPLPPRTAAMRFTSEVT